MKTIRNPFIRRAFLASTLTACIAAPTAFAADLTWDNGVPTGNWNTTDANWTSSTWSDANPDNAVFNDRNETVTLTQAITAGSLSFLAGGAARSAPPDPNGQFALSGKHHGQWHRTRRECGLRGKCQ